VAKGGVSDESLQCVRPEDISDIAHPPLAMQLDAIAAHDTGRLLPAVLKAVKPQVSMSRSIGVPGDAKNTTLVFELV
jgi:hypothetical protein